MFEAAIQVKSTHLIKSCLNTRKKRENMKVNEILHKSPSKRSFRYRNHRTAKTSWCQRKRWHHLPYL